MFDGIVHILNLKGGFGFIANPHMPDIFFHQSYLEDGLAFDETLEGRRVEFRLQQASKGRQKAIDIRPACD